MRGEYTRNNTALLSPNIAAESYGCPDICLCELTPASGSSVNNDPNLCVELQADQTLTDFHDGCCDEPEMGCQVDECWVNLGKVRFRLKTPPPNGCTCTTIRFEGIDVDGATWADPNLPVGTWSPWRGGGMATALCGNNDPHTGFTYVVWQIWCDSTTPVQLMTEAETFYFCVDCDHQ